jgi:acetolactate decarboxylase
MISIALASNSVFKCYSVSASIDTAIGYLLHLGTSVVNGEMMKGLLIGLSLALSSITTMAANNDECAPILEKRVDYGVCMIGSRLNMFQQNDLSGRVSLDQLPTQSGFVGVGPVENLKGEVTLYNGNLFVSTLNEKGEDIAAPRDNKQAIFLGLGYARDWKKIPINSNLKGLSKIEEFVANQAKLNGIDLEAGFPFKIEGEVESLTYHVIFKSDVLPHSMKLHRAAKKKFNKQNIQVGIAGIYSTEAQVGHITHPGKRTHLHVVVKQKNGHIDDVVIKSGAVLYLPASS